jgi:membrane protein required for colicin V production
MHILDIIFVILLLILAIKCLIKGFMASLIQLIGLVVIVYTVAKAGQIVKLLVIDHLGWGNVPATIAAYLLIALIIFIFIRIMIFMVNRVVEVLSLKWLNRLLGAVFGILNGLLLIAVLIIISDVLPFKKEIREFTDKSYIVRNLRVITEEIETKYPRIRSYQEPLKEKLEEELDKGKKKVEEQVEEVL